MLSVKPCVCPAPRRAAAGSGPEVRTDAGIAIGTSGAALREPLHGFELRSQLFPLHDDPRKEVVQRADRRGQPHVDGGGACRVERGEREAGKGEQRHSRMELELMPEDLNSCAASSSQTMRLLHGRLDCSDAAPSSPAGVSVPHALLGGA